MKQENKIILNYPVFNGTGVLENASVELADGIITAVRESESACSDTDCFLMPGLMDAHTHITTLQQTEVMLKSGITSACDVAASASLVENAGHFRIISSAGMTMGTLNGKAYVKKAIDAGAAYIKVLLMEPNLMPKIILKEICQAAHEYGVKVAVHATSVKAVNMCISCGADILLHVPMKEVFPKELALTIAEKKIHVAPTLVMMEAFAHSNRNGYVPSHFENAKHAVSLLHECGVQILTATDANDGSFAPAVGYGASLHYEMKLLTECGMTPTEVLASTTKNTANAFGIDDIGIISAGKKAILLLIDGRPDKNINDIQKIKQIWVDGIPVL